MLLNNCFINKNFGENYNQITEKSFEYLSNAYKNMLFDISSGVYENTIVKKVVNSNSNNNVKEFVIFSDVDIVHCIEENLTKFEKIEKFKITYWNLSGDIIKYIPTKKEIIIVPGLSKSLIKHLISFPYDDYYCMLSHILNHPRYEILATTFEKTYSQRSEEHTSELQSH